MTTKNKFWRWIEKSIEGKEITDGYFLDIEGIFNNLTSCSNEGDESTNRLLDLVHV